MAAKTKSPILALPKFRKYTDEKREFYLSTGMATQSGRPLVGVTRWDADYALNDVVRAFGGQNGIVTLSTLYDTLRAAEQDADVRDSVFSEPAEWTSHLILNPNAPTETEQYVLGDAKGKPLKPNKRARLLNPTERHKDGEREIVHAAVFDIPFKLKDGYYNGVQDLDPKTGFLAKAPRAQGKYYVVFGEGEQLYATFLLWNGDVNCNWEPWRSDGDVGLRGRSTGSEGSEKLFETKEDVLQQAQAETVRGQEETIRAQPEKSRREILLGMVGELESHYTSGLEKLKILRQELQKDE